MLVWPILLMRADTASCVTPEELHATVLTLSAPSASLPSLPVGGAMVETMSRSDELNSTTASSLKVTEFRPPAARDARDARVDGDCAPPSATGCAMGWHQPCGTVGREHRGATFGGPATTDRLPQLLRKELKRDTPG